jgi:hypothetical protein
MREGLRFNAKNSSPTGMRKTSEKDERDIFFENKLATTLHERLRLSALIA